MGGSRAGGRKDMSAGFQMPLSGDFPNLTGCLVMECNLVGKSRGIKIIHSGSDIEHHLIRSVPP